MVNRTMRGKLIDMDKLTRQNELMPAIGNMKVNARGDQLGAGGKIVKKHEEIIDEYYQSNPKAKIQTKRAPVVNKIVPTPPEPVEAVKPASTAPKKVPAGE